MYQDIRVDIRTAVTPIWTSYWKQHLSFSDGFNGNLYGNLSDAAQAVLPLPGASYIDLQNGLQEVRRLDILNPEIRGAGGVIVGIM